MSAQPVEVIVRGRVGPALASSLEGFDVTPLEDGTTRVAGVIEDQSALLGLLSLFADLHIEVVSVNPIDAGGDA